MIGTSRSGVSKEIVASGKIGGECGFPDGLLISGEASVANSVSVIAIPGSAAQMDNACNERCIDRPLKLLVIEDNRLDFAMIEMHLKQEGAATEMRRVATETELAAALEDGSWDVALADYNVPGMPWEELLLALRAYDLNLPILLVTGALDERTAIGLLKQGVHDFVLKGNLSRLLPALEQCMREARLRRDLAQTETALRLNEERLREASRDSTLNGAAAQSQEWTNLSSRLAHDTLVRRTLQLEQEVATRKQIETELRESKQRIAGIIASAMDAIIAIDAEQRIVLFNPAAATMFGCPESEALGEPFWRFIPEAARATHQDHVEQLFHSGTGARRMGGFGELNGRRADGEQFPIEASISRTPVGGRNFATVIVRDITERRRLEECIRQAAQHDPLTMLPNRTLIYEHAERMLASSRRGSGSVAFLFIDLDRFKPINDSYGHDAGDAVLKETARRLAACVREEDLLGRLAGDEFIVALSHVHREQDAAKVALHILERLRQPYTMNQLSVHLAASIGISLYPKDAASVAELIKCADTAMYQCKQSGSNGFRLFHPQARDQAEVALKIERHLRKGVESCRFELYFQPIVDLASKRTVAAEALLRWPEMKIAPGAFIPVAEAAGYMPALGSWVLQEACRLLRGWRECGLPQFPVTVNVSPAQFRQKDFVQTVATALEGAGLACDDVELEITESLAMQNLAAAIRILNALRAMGVRVALDDFGTGYSSLAYLAQLPVDILKLDQSFVQNLGLDANSATVAESVLALAKSVGLTVVAEGVESTATLAFLERWHCPQAQGMLFSAPLPAKKFAAWVKTRLM